MAATSASSTPSTPSPAAWLPSPKIASYTYVNAVVAVLLGIFFRGEHPGPAKLAGMAAILLAVFLLTTAQVTAKARPESVEALDQVPAE